MLTPSEYIKAGIRIAPLKKAGVHPPFDNWSEREFKAGDFKSHHDIAIVCGRPDRNPVIDIDLDHELTIRLASAILPKTGCIFGRLTAPRSHWLYKSSGPTKKWKVNGIGMLVELRSVGGVTVCPPTEHAKTGEIREWDECKPEHIQTVGYDELTSRLNVLATAALLAHCWPTQGMRHDYALGVGGWFAKELDLAPDDTVGIVRKMMSFVEDEEKDDRIRAAKESADKHLAGTNVSAFNTLEPIIGKPFAILLRKWSVRPLKGGGATAGVGGSTSGSQQLSSSSADHSDPVSSNGEGVVDALARIEVNIRCNTRTMNSEYRIANSDIAKRLQDPPADEWIGDSDDVQSVLRVTIESSLTFASGKKTIAARYPIVKWEDGIRYARSTNMVDPFKLWLESLPKWDGKVRLISLAQTVWTLQYPEEEEYSCWALYSRFIAAIARTYNPGCKADEMIVLQSEREGVLKSTSIGLTFPPDLKVELRRSAWLHEGLRLDTFDPRSPLESIGQAVFVEAGEMQGRKKADVDRLKAWLSQQRDRHRFAFGRVATDIPRRFIIFGTANDVDCLPADMGDGRRYLPIALLGKMDGFEARKWFDSNRDQLWAEALNNFNEGETHFLQASGIIREQHKSAITRHRGGAMNAEYAADVVLRKIDEPINSNLMEYDTDGKVYVKSVEVHRIAKEVCGMSSGEMHNVYKGLRLKDWSSTTKRINGVTVRIWKNDQS